MSATKPATFEQLAAEMRQIFPQRDKRPNLQFQDVRAENQRRFERAMAARQRPARVS